VSCFRRVLLAQVSAIALTGWFETRGTGEKAETLKR